MNTKSFLHRNGVFLATLFLIASGTKSAAIPITATVLGHAYADNPGLGLMKDMPMSVKYTFESTTPDSNSDSKFGDYSSGVTFFEFKVGGYTWTSSSGQILVADDQPEGDDYFARIFNTSGIAGPVLNGWTAVSLGLDFTYGDTTTFLSDDLPIAVPDLSKFPASRPDLFAVGIDFPSAVIAMNLGNGFGTTGFAGIIDSFVFDPLLSQPPPSGSHSNVPDSGNTIVLFLFGLLPLLVWRHSRRNLRKTQIPSVNPSVA